MKQTSEAITAKPTARANIVLALFLLYWLCIPHAVDPVLTALGLAPLSAIAHAITMLTVRFLPPILLYLLISKQRPAAVFSTAPLSLKNALYIAVFTISLRVIEFLLEFGLPFVFGLAPPPMQQMAPAWVHLLVVVLLATVLKEFFFRGPLYSEYRDQGVSILKTALVTGLFFGLVHEGIAAITASAILGIFWAYLLYYTQSIWAPLLSHALYNAMWQLHPAFHIRTQAEYEAFLPTFVRILGVAALLAIPAMILSAKKFWTENRREQKEQAEESQAFRWSYWALIVLMIAVIFIFRI